MIARDNFFKDDLYTSNSLKPLYLYNTVIIDTETTGVMHYDEICEITVIDAITSKPLINTLIKPMRSIPKQVTQIHGISNDDVADAPSYPDIHDQLMTIFKEKNIIIYNEDFDIRLIQQTAKIYDLLSSEVSELLSPGPTIFCAMKWYAEFYGQWSSYKNSYKWQSLRNATKQQNIDVSDLKAHRALADCQITQQLVHEVNRKIILQQQFNRE